MSHNLRKKFRVSYYEPDEPNFDDYVYCEACGDYVYEYCSIHGPLLVIPDDEVPLKSTFPEVVPRAALTIPHVFLHLAPSIIPGAGIGVFTTLTLPRGVRFGPYRGLRSDTVDSTYCWQVYDKNYKPSYVIDATDVARSNWMRYVNCARHWSEQNLVAYQYRGQIYYRTIKIIPRFTELMVFYGSEFANVLGVDLRKYNDKKYYPAILRNAFKTKRLIVTTTMPEMNKLSSSVNNITTLKIEKIGEIIAECFEPTQYSESLAEVDSQVYVNTLMAAGKSESNEFGTNHDELYDEILDSTAHRCEICLKLYKKPRYLRRHVKEVHGPCRYYCNDCDYKAKSKWNIIKHIIRANCSKQMGDNATVKDTILKCNICDKKFTKLIYLRRHIKIFHSDFRPYFCNVCDFKTNYNSRLSKHKLKKHSIPSTYTCKTCRFKTDSEEFYNLHTNSHLVKNTTDVMKPRTYKNYYQQPRACDVCDFITDSRNVYKRHKAEHKGNIFKCTVCDYSSHQKWNLTRHIRNMGH